MPSITTPVARLDTKRITTTAATRPARALRVCDMKHSTTPNRNKEAYQERSNASGVTASSLHSATVAITAAYAPTALKPVSGNTPLRRPSSSTSLGQIPICRTHQTSSKVKMVHVQSRIALYSPTSETVHTIAATTATSIEYSTDLNSVQGGNTD